MAVHECYAVDVAGFRLSLIQTGFDRFTVVYGLQEKTGLNYAAAAAEFGQCLMHALACEGRIDNRTAREARAAGDTRPYWES